MQLIRRFFLLATPYFTTCLLLLCLPQLAQAQQNSHAYRDGLETLWQSLRSQGSVPTPVIRWVGDVKYHLSGQPTLSQRQHILNGLSQLSKLTGLVFEDATSLGKHHDEIRLVIDVANGTDLNIEMPCYVEHQKITSFRLQKVLLRMGKKWVHQCALHELMHAVGIVGHPDGQTQLSYAPKQKHTYTELDQLMLQTWYSNQVRPGMNPLEMITLLSERWMLLHLEKNVNAEAVRTDFLKQLHQSVNTTGSSASD